MSTRQTLEPAKQTTVSTYEADLAHSSAEFAVKHLMIPTVKGKLAIRKAVIVHDAWDPTRSSVEAEIDVASIDTGVQARDDHLRSPDFFDAANHPTMTFRSTRVEMTAPDSGIVEGELTIRGVAKPIVLEVEKDGEARDPWGKHRVGLTATTTLDRREWGLTWNQVLEAGGVMVSDKVKVTLHLSATRRD